MEMAVSATPGGGSTVPANVETPYCVCALREQVIDKPARKKQASFLQLFTNNYRLVTGI